MQPFLIFDIETIPDLTTGRLLHPEIATLDDKDALTALMAIREAEAGNSFMQLPLHKIACLSFLWVKDNQFSLKSLSLNNLSEPEILNTFFRAFTQKPTLISWNGSGFDLPVLSYRALHHKIPAPALFGNQSTRGGQYANYMYKYGDAHIDLMDKLAFGNYSYKQKLDTIASLCGFAGKGDLDGSQVVPMVQAGEWQKLTTYCESDVLNTWLIFLRWQLLMGRMTPEQVAHFENLTKANLNQIKNSDSIDGTETPLRHQAFLDAWQD